LCWDYGLCNNFDDECLENYRVKCMSCEMFTVQE